MYAAQRFIEDSVNTAAFCTFSFFFIPPNSFPGICRDNDDLV